MNEPNWVILFDGGILTRKDLALSDLGDFEYSVFMVKTDDQVIFMYEPNKERCYIFLDSGPIMLPIRGQPFFHWKNTTTIGSDGRVFKKSRVLSFGLKDKIILEEKDFGFEAIIHEQEIHNF